MNTKRVVCEDDYQLLQAIHNGSVVATVPREVVLGDRVDVEVTAATDSANYTGNEQVK